MEYSERGVATTAESKYRGDNKNWMNREQHVKIQRNKIEQHRSSTTGHSPTQRTQKRSQSAQDVDCQSRSSHLRLHELVGSINTGNAAVRSDLTCRWAAAAGVRRRRGCGGARKSCELDVPWFILIDQWFIFFDDVVKVLARKVRPLTSVGDEDRIAKRVAS